MSTNSNPTKKKTRRRYRGKHPGVSHENNQGTTMLGLTTDALVAQDEELTTLGTLLMAKLEVSSPSFKPKLECTKHNGSVTCETEKQVVSSSNSSESDVDIVQYNKIHSMEVASTSWDSLSFSSSPRSETNNKKHNGTIQDESKSTGEEDEQDRTTTPISIMAGCCETDVSSTEDMDIVTCKSNMEITSDMSQESHKIAKLHLPQPQEENLVSTQISLDTKAKRYKNERKEITAKVLNNKNMLKECCGNKEVLKNNVTKKTKNTEKTEKLPRKEDVFLDHIPVAEIEKILKDQSSDNAQYVKGTLRVNAKYNNYAYLSIGDEERDLLINGITDRNRAFDGDLVVVRINSQENWQKLANGQVQKTGVVVCILEKVHSRKVTGCLIHHMRKHKPYVIIKPRDQRIPLIRISSESLPSSYYKHPECYNNTVFFVNIHRWAEPNYALGSFLEVIGKANDINTIIQAILFENHLDVSSYGCELLQGLPDSDYILTDNDIKNREDWRNKCIFTIDPATAVDLDDAVSCDVLDNGNYEIGVHISDVTHYLKFFSPLDKEVSKRAVTVYLPHIAYHMLPEQLCRVCSLLPGEDKLAFSVIWEMTPNAKIVKHRFVKTIIRSCCRMSYDSAQVIIDNPKLVSYKDFSLDIKGNYTVSSLSDVVNNLFKLSVILRNRRFANGALRLDQPKIKIHMHPTIQQDGIPIPVNYDVDESKDSNKLIEEFMLLANMTVAEQLYNTIPETALLRIHQRPFMHRLVTTNEILQKYGINLDIQTSGGLHASIQRYKQNIECNSSTVNNSMKYIMMVITNMCSKTMARAKYKCASTIPSFRNLSHYALNAPLYTHFTSPMRRYSDCIVHHLLHATIENIPLPKEWTANLCSRIAEICNVKKHSAKLAQEQCTELFFTYMVHLAGGFNALAIVSEVKEHDMDIILCDTGIKLKVYFKDIEHTTATVAYSAIFSIPTITINWKKPPSEQFLELAYLKTDHHADQTH